MTGIAGSCPRAPATATAPSRAPSSRSSAGPRARRSRTSGCSRARCERATDRVGRRAAEGDRRPRGRLRRRRAARRGVGRRDRQGARASPTSRGRRHHRRAAAAVPCGTQFAPPTLETVVVPRTPSRPTARCAPRSPSSPNRIRSSTSVRTTRSARSTVSLYGEVQQEVIQATLASDYGVAVTFRATTTHPHRTPGRVPARRSSCSRTTPIRTSATIGLRVEPAPPGTGVEFRLAVDPRTIPTYIFKTAERFTGVDARARRAHARRRAVRLAGHRLRRHDAHVRLLRRRRGDQADATDASHRSRPTSGT